MNKHSQLISLTFAAAAGVALFSLANAPFTAALRGDVILGLGTSLALVGFAAYDYSRRPRSLSSPGRLLRPKARIASDACRLEGSRKDCLAA